MIGIDHHINPTICMLEIILQKIDSSEILCKLIILMSPFFRDIFSYHSTHAVLVLNFNVSYPSFFLGGFFSGFFFFIFFIFFIMKGKKNKVIFKSISNLQMDSYFIGRLPIHIFICQKSTEINLVFNVYHIN